MSAEERRISVDLGELSRPSAVLWAVQQLPDLAVRNAIVGYLEDPGILLERTWPPSWFYWLDSGKRVFIARCGEPPAVDAEHRDQPWNYFVEAEIAGGFGNWTRAQVAIATGFYHESLMHESCPEDHSR